MSEQFHERFDIEYDTDEVKKRFVNRVHNDIFSGYFYKFHPQSDDQYYLCRQVASALGEPHNARSLTHLAGTDFHRNLLAVETLYANTGGRNKRPLEERVLAIMAMSEKDLSIKWAEGKFFRTGVPMLDDALVNDPLKWLRGQDYKSVVVAFERGLGHLLAAEKEPSRAADVITDMHEALEGVAKRVTGRDTNLSANAESFISKLKASDGHKRLLKEYLTYANDGLRHAASMDKDKPTINVREAESFVYLTGLFIRLAMT
jgi:hypothetical protein